VSIIYQLLNKEGEDTLVALLEKERIHNLQFYEYLPFLSNQDKCFLAFIKDVDEELIGAVYFSPFYMGFTLKNKHA